MVRRYVLGTLFGSLLVAGIAAQGCSIPASGGSDCDPKFPLKCCQCPIPEVCPPWKDKWPILPDYCAQYIDDGLVVGGDQFGGAGSLCVGGTCVSPAPEGWTSVLFALTWPDEPPPCPAEAPIQVFEGREAPPDRACAKCSCDTPESSCALPTTFSVSTEPCSNPGGGIMTNFNAPSNWDGSCNDANAIAENKQCGGVSCTRSITISLPELKEKPCTPHTEPGPEVPVLRTSGVTDQLPVGRACKVENPPTNCAARVCATKTPAFGACIIHEGDQVCPEGWTGDRNVLYGIVDDKRSCAACACDPPVGGVCQVKWRTFSDAACTAENSANDVTIDMTSTTACADLVPGVALAGKSAQIIKAEPGSCVPTGGKLEGELKLDAQHTICCQAGVQAL